MEKLLDHKRKFDMITKPDIGPDRRHRRGGRTYHPREPQRQRECSVHHGLAKDGYPTPEMPSRRL